MCYAVGLREEKSFRDMLVLNQVVEGRPAEPTLLLIHLHRVFPSWNQELDLREGNDRLAREFPDLRLVLNDAGKLLSGSLDRCIILFTSVGLFLLQRDVEAD